jgi:hypothetical protein
MVIAIVREVPGSGKRCLATAFLVAARLATATAPRIPGVTLGLARSSRGRGRPGGTRS